MTALVLLDHPAMTNQRLPSWISTEANLALERLVRIICPIRLVHLSRVCQQVSFVFKILSAATAFLHFRRRSHVALEMIVQVGLGHEASAALAAEELPDHATLMFLEQVLIREGLVAHGTHEWFQLIGGVRSIDGFVQMDQVAVVLQICLGCKLFLTAAALPRLL